MDTISTTNDSTLRKTAVSPGQLGLTIKLLVATANASTLAMKTQSTTQILHSFELSRTQNRIITQKNKDEK
jgi:hypothetical protein